MIALMERSRCWFVPMRPVTPFMMIPTLCVVMVKRKWLRPFRRYTSSDGVKQVSLARVPADGDCLPGDISRGLFRALRCRTGRQRRRRTDARRRQRAIEFLPPMRDVPARTVDIHHVQWRVARVGQLMKDRWRQKNGLSRRDLLSLGTDTDFAASFQHHVNFLLLLIVPGHLPAIRFEHHIAH